MIAALPPGWSTADFNAWFNPIYLDATAQRDIYVYARTPRALQTNVSEWLVTGSTSSPLPVGWSMLEFTDWITALINEALAAYYVDILSQTPAYLLAPVKERINYQQPPPTTDLITGGGALTPGTPGVPGVLPAGATLTRASTAWYWEGSNYIRNPTAIGAIAGSPGGLATNWSSNGSYGTLVRTIVGTGVEDGIPYLEVRFAGTSTPAGSYGVSFDLNNQIASAVGQTWVVGAYVRLVAGSLANITSIITRIYGRLVGGSASPDVVSTTIVPTSAPLRTQFSTASRTITDPTTAFVQPAVVFSFADNLPVDFTLRLGLPTLTTTSKPFVPVLTQVNIDAPRFPVSPTTGLPLGMHNEPAATNTIRNASAGGAVPGTPGTPPTNWSIAPTGSGVTRTVVGTGVEDGIPYIDFQYAGTPSVNVFLFMGFEPGNAIAAALGQTWSASVYARLMAGSLVGTGTPRLILSQYNAGGSSIGGAAQTNFVPTSAALRTQRIDVTGAMNLALTAFCSPQVSISGTAGVPLDFTIRLGLPQFVQADAPSSPIVTTTVALTRAADVFNAPVPNGTYNIDVVRGTTTTYASQVITTGKWLVPTSPSPVRSVAARAVSVEALSFNFMTAALPAGATLTRASAGWTTGNTGVLTSYANNVPRFAYDPTALTLRGLLNERAITNFVRNASCGGVVPGTPGTAPTLWNVASTANGVTRECVGSGVEDGIPYFDVRYFGTPSGGSSATIRPEAPTTTAAVEGETWLAQFNYRLMAGSMTNAGVRVVLGYRDGGGAGISGPATTVVTPTNAPLRTQSATMSWTAPATTATVNSDIRVDWTVGQPIDITLRVGAPQMIKASAPYSPILSTNAALLRAADVLTAVQANVLPGFWDATVTRQSGVTVTRGIDLSAGGTLTYPVPNDVSPVQSVKFAPSV
jgi:hypothetical protein